MTDYIFTVVEPLLKKHPEKESAGVSEIISKWFDEPPRQLAGNIWSFSRGDFSAAVLQSLLEGEMLVGVEKTPFMVVPIGKASGCFSNDFAVNITQKHNTILIVAPQMKVASGTEEYVQDYLLSKARMVDSGCHTMRLTWAFRGQEEVDRSIDFEVITTMIPPGVGSILIPVAKEWNAGNNAVAAGTCYEW